ncbi:transposase [Xenorhabdus sp. SGI240]|uniref:transposase n=1 Tax=Xenorhabdus sp. SGI240 TaxID=3158262 RepID=UPI0032B86AD7
MVRIIILKHFHNLSDEKREYQLLDRMSWSRFCRLTDIINIPDRHTIWCFEKRIGQEVPAHCLKRRSISFRHRDSFPEGGNSLMPR